jgi:hypothetical protein
VAPKTAILWGSSNASKALGWELKTFCCGRSEATKTLAMSPFSLYNLVTCQTHFTAENPFGEFSLQQQKYGFYVLSPMLVFGVAIAFSLAVNLKQMMHKSTKQNP